MSSKGARLIAAASLMASYNNVDTAIAARWAWTALKVLEDMEPRESVTEATISKAQPGTLINRMMPPEA